MFKNLFSRQENNPNTVDIQVVADHDQNVHLSYDQTDDIPSQDEYDLEVELQKSDKRARFIGNAFLIILALTTFSFGYSSVYINIDMSDLSWLDWLGAQAARVTAGIILTLLLDGLRYMWENEEVSSNRVDTQQIIASVMKWINFTLSLLASLINLPELINLLGAEFPSIVEDSTSLMVLGLMLSVAVNGLAYYLARSTSPLQQRKKSLSSNKSKITQMGINQFDRAQHVATRRANAQMNGMINPLANMIADTAITDQLSVYGFKLNQLAPPTPAETPTATDTNNPAQNHTQYATQQAGGDLIAFDNEDEARKHAQDLANATGVQTVLLIDGNIADIVTPKQPVLPGLSHIPIQQPHQNPVPSTNGYHSSSGQGNPL